jgi:hypothetical protein
MMAPLSGSHRLLLLSSLARMHLQAKMSLRCCCPPSQLKVTKMIVTKIRKEAGPSSTDQEAPNVNQVRIVPLELVL